MRTRQLSLIPRQKVEYGGEKQKGRRKVQRPFTPKLPIHVTVRSCRARGAQSLLHQRNKWRVHELLERTSKRYGIRVYRFANVGNHLHLLLQARTRRDFQAFLRDFTGSVAVLVTGAIKGSPGKFWDHTAWSKLVSWGKQFEGAARYILLNVLEASGFRSKALLAKLEAEGIVLIRGAPPG